VCTILLSLPFALSALPKPEDITLPVLGGMLFLGFISAGAGFLVYVYALGVLGPTTMSVYSNFLPVTATLFGWILLGEMIGGVQLLGGIIVISAGYLVIKEKAKVDKKRLEVLCDDRET
ncbi:MAG: DMT family transporter, partial [Eubacteriales bacterium]|nr:DMT family transporter [Eubacteriales bacterium]